MREQSIVRPSFADHRRRQLLERDAALRTALRNRYLYILRDEFHDTTRQTAPLELLGQRQQNIFALATTAQPFIASVARRSGSFKLVPGARFRRVATKAKIHALIGSASTK